MNLRINNDWRITTDPHNFIIEKRKIAKTDTQKHKAGDELWESIAFYPDLCTALSGFVRHSLLWSGADSLESLKSSLLDIHSSIQAIKEGIDK